MLKVFVFVLCATSLSSKSPGICISNRVESHICQSNVCFSHYYTFPEGHVESFDCDEEPNKLNKSSCLQILRNSNQSRVCLESANVTHCCCLSTDPAKICAEEERNTDQLVKLWTFEQTISILFGHVVLLAFVMLLFVLYKVSVRHWSTDNVQISGNTRLEVVLLGKASEWLRIEDETNFQAIVLLFCFLVIYFPFRRSCKNHPKGVFTTPLLFLCQVFDPVLETAIYFSFPLVFFLFESTFYMTVKTSGIINKTSGLAIAVFKLLTTPLILFRVFFLSFVMLSSSEKPDYCSIDGITWQLMFSNFFLFCYHVLLVLHIVFLYQINRADSEILQVSDEASNHVATILSTPTVETQIESEMNEMIYIYPKPFHVPRYGISVLNIKNNRNNEWIALRALLSTTGYYKLYPSKFIIPPGKEISIEVDQCTKADSPTSQHNLLLEWYSLGPSPPSADTQRLWSKPFLVPQNQWHYFVLPIYVDQSIVSQRTSPLTSQVSSAESKN